MCLIDWLIDRSTEWKIILPILLYLLWLVKNFFFVLFCLDSIAIYHRKMRVLSSFDFSSLFLSLFRIADCLSFVNVVVAVVMISILQSQSSIAAYRVDQVPKPKKKKKMSSDTIVHLTFCRQKMKKFHFYFLCLFWCYFFLVCQFPFRVLVIFFSLFIMFIINIILTFSFKIQIIIHLMISMFCVEPSLVYDDYDHDSLSLFHLIIIFFYFIHHIYIYSLCVFCDYICCCRWYNSWKKNYIWRCCCCCHVKILVWFVIECACVLHTHILVLRIIWPDCNLKEG